MNDFTIVFDRPEGYCPGENVSGRVVIQACTPIETRYLKICIHGIAHTKWGEGIDEHYSEQNYVSGEKIAWVANDGSGTLPAGHHIFPFSFSLPVGCPPSFKGLHGNVSYYVRMELDKPRPWKANKVEKSYFTVVSNSSLDLSSPENGPIIKKDEKQVGVLFNKGSVSLEATIPKQRWASGEYLPITVNIVNNSKRPQTCLRAKLLQHSNYFSICKPTSSSHLKQHNSDCKVVSMSKKNINVVAGAESQEKLKISIPKITPSFNSPLITVHYSLMVMLDTNSSSSLSCEFNVVLVASPDTTRPTIGRSESLPPPYSDSILNAPPYSEVASSENASKSPPSYESTMFTV